MDIKISGGDLVLVNGDFVLIDGVEEVAQEINTRLLLIAGECRYDQEAGIDPVFWEPTVTDDERAQLVAQAIRATPGVVYVYPPALEVDTTSRTMSITYQVEASVGELRRRLAGEVVVV